MIRDNILNILNKIYEDMTPEELDQAGVFPVAVGGETHYCHSGFNCQEVDHCKELEKDSKIDRKAMEILKHSLSELNKSRDKHKSYNWTPEEMAQYAYNMAHSMIQESKEYD